jgi:hypothetical protein
MGEPWFWTKARECMLVNCQPQCFPTGGTVSCRSIDEPICFYNIAASAEEKAMLESNCRQRVDHCPTDNLIGCCNIDDEPMTACYYAGSGATPEGCSEDYETWTTTPP